MDSSFILAVAAGVAIAAACGLRAFLPLFVLGVAAHLGWITLDPRAAWLAGSHALIALGVATVLEVAADKIPVVDHALDSVATLIRPAAAWLGANALFHRWPEPWGPVVSFALAALALGVHAVKAKIRLGGTAVTLGTGNPVVSAVEDVGAFTMAIVGLLAPLVAVLAAIVLLVFLMRRRAARRPANV